MPLVESLRQSQPTIVLFKTTQSRKINQPQTGNRDTREKTNALRSVFPRLDIIVSRPTDHFLVSVDDRANHSDLSPGLSFVIQTRGCLNSLTRPFSFLLLVFVVVSY